MAKSQGHLTRAGCHPYTIQSDGADGSGKVNNGQQCA
jgi:hypothetical protein